MHHDEDIAVREIEEFLQHLHVMGRSGYTLRSYQLGLADFAGWLVDEGLVDQAAAERAIAERTGPDLSEVPGRFDPQQIARDVAGDLRRLYGDRLSGVVLFGSWARGDAHPESDIDLLVVLDRVDSVWDELRRMDAVLWRYSFGSDTVVTALPVAKSDLDEQKRPLLVRAQAEGLRVA